VTVSSGGLTDRASSTIRQPAFIFRVPTSQSWRKATVDLMVRQSRIENCNIDLFEARHRKNPYRKIAAV
jgi:hypothetical protein